MTLHSVRHTRSEEEPSRWWGVTPEMTVFESYWQAATQNQSICQSINQPMIHKPLKIIYLGVNRTRTIIKICLTFSTSSWLYIKYSKCSPWARIIIVHFTFTNKHSTSCQKLTHLFEFTRCRLQSSYSVSFLPHLFTSQTDCLSSWTLNLLTIAF